MTRTLGIPELERRLLQAASGIGYRVLLGEKPLTANLSWDKERISDYHRKASKGRRAWGLCDYHHKLIWLEPRMNPQHRTSVLVHELGHALLHNQYKLYRPRQWEAEAEQVRRLVGEGVGIGLPSNGDDFKRLGPWGRRKAIRRGRRAAGRILRAIGA